MCLDVSYISKICNKIFLFSKVDQNKLFQSEQQCKGSKEIKVFEEDQCSKYSSTNITIEIEEVFISKEKF